MSDPGVDATGASGLDVDRTDREFVERLAGGDLGALDLLYEQYGAMAFSIAFRITGDRTAAEDVVQEAFLGAWRSAARYVDARGSVRTWLLSIVHHRAIDVIRRRRQTIELPDSEAHLPEALTLPDTWTEVRQRLDRDDVAAALAAISDVQREAIELAYFAGLTQAEIAERTGVPLGTVKGRMRLGLAGMRAALQARERAGARARDADAADARAGTRVGDG
ncbi:MAG TPA: sigma-70 family RNA polymerase sigma factor [Candidatus Binatia bacterium]|nr:sigma-70 family RNA polymerase sigma factor [Candidatus Binatia bacterium]